jgi:WD40 repeat protein
MNLFRKIVYILASLSLAACSASPGPAPTAVPAPRWPDPVQKEAEAPGQMPLKQGTLAESVPAAVWQGNANGSYLVPIDPASGQPLADYDPIEIGQAISHAYSPDGNTLAVIGFASSENPRGGTLHMIDLGTWEDQAQEMQLQGYVNAMTFSPDGKRLAISYGNTLSQVLVFEVSKPLIKSKTAVRQSSLNYLVYKMKFNADSSGLMLYGSEIENRYTVNEMSPNPPLVTLLDTTDLSLRWETSLEGVRHGVVPKGENGEASPDLHQPGRSIYLFPGLAFAPDRDILYVAHPDEDVLTTVDFSAQKVSIAEIKPELSWIERLLSLTAGVAHAKIAEGTSKQVAISPDGQFLYIVGQRNDLIQDKDGNWQVIENPLGLQIVRAEDGSRLAYYDTEASELSISPDGRYLYLRELGGKEVSHWTQIFDTSSNQPVTRMDGMWLMPTRRVNGEPVLVSSVWINDKGKHRNAILDSQSVLAEWISPDYLFWLTAP